MELGTDISCPGQNCDCQQCATEHLRNAETPTSWMTSALLAWALGPRELVQFPWTSPTVFDRLACQLAESDSLNT
jgi:hypothetical protein